MKSNKSFRGIVELWSVKEDGSKELVHTEENIATQFPFQLPLSSWNENTMLVKLMDTDTVNADVPNLLTTSYQVPGNVLRNHDVIVDRTKTARYDVTTINREYNIICRFSANGSIQPIDTVFLVNGTSTLLAYTKLTTPYQQQAAESIEVRYRMIMVVDATLPLIEASYWHGLFNNYQDNKEIVAGLNITPGLEQMPEVHTWNVGKFNPARDTGKLGLILRTIGSQIGSPTNPIKDDIRGLRFIGGLQNVPGLPVGNIFNHSKDSDAWEEDLSNLATSAGAINVGSGHTISYLDPHEADMSVIQITKEGDIGIAKWAFNARPMGCYMPDNVGFKDFGFFKNQNALTVRSGDKSFTMINSGSPRTFAYAIDDTHLIMSNPDGAIAVQHIQDIGIDIFDSDTHPILAAMSSWTAADITPTGTIYATDGTNLLKIDGITTGSPTFTLIPNVNFGNEAPLGLSCSATHLFVRTASNIYEGDLNGGSFTVKIATPVTGGVDIIVNADETEGYIDGGSQDHWWDVQNGTTTATTQFNGLHYSERFKMWFDRTSIRKFGTNNSRVGKIVFERDDVMIIGRTTQGIPELVNGVTLPTNMFSLTTNRNWHPVNKKASSSKIMTEDLLGFFFLAPEFNDIGSMIPKVKHTDLVADIRDYRWDGTALVEGHVADVVVSSGTNNTPIPRKHFAPDSYTFDGFQYYDISANVAADLSAGFSLAAGVTHTDKSKETYKGIDQTLFQIALTKTSGVQVIYRDDTDNIVIRETQDNGTVTDTTVGATVAVNTSARIVAAFSTGSLKIYRDGSLLVDHPLTVNVNVDNTAGDMKAYVGLAVHYLQYGCLYEEDGLAGILDNLIIYNKSLTLAEAGEDNTNGTTTNTALIISRALLTEDLDESKVLAASETTPLGVNLDFIDTTGAGTSFVLGDYFNFATIANGILKDNVTEWNMDFTNPDLPLKETALTGTVNNTTRTLTEPVIANSVTSTFCNGCTSTADLNIDVDIYNDELSGEVFRTANSTQILRLNTIQYTSPDDKGVIDTVGGQIRYNGVDLRAAAGLTTVRGVGSYVHNLEQSSALPPRVHRLGDGIGAVRQGAYRPDFQAYEQTFNNNVEVLVGGTPRTVIIEDDINLNVAAGTVHLSLSRSLIKFTSADVGSAYEINNLFATVRGFYDESVI